MAELGAGAGSGYPAAIDTKQTYVNGPNPVTDSNSRVDQEFMNDAYVALVAIETELGVNPSGASADLAARLSGTELEKTANKDAAAGYAGLSGSDLKPDTYGGFRHAVGNWEQQNVPVSQASVALKLNADNAEIVLPYAGSIMAISVAATEARSAGTLTVKPTINGTEKAISAVLNATNTQFKHTTQAKDTETFVAGDRLGVKITTDSTWAPTTSDIIVTIWLEM